MAERSAPRRFLRIGGYLVAFALCGWIALNGARLTMSKVLEKGNPRAAMGYWPTATAASALAGSLAADPKAVKANVDEIERLSREALRRSPLSPAAARALAMTAALRGDEKAARHNFAYSEAMSRREPVTQLWMIEESVRRDDIPAALTHYNRALLTTEPLRATLIPTLSGAADDPAVMRHLTPLLGQRPEWWSAFVDDYSNRAQSAPGIARVISSLKLTPQNAFERPRIIALLKRMVTIGAPQEAFNAFARLPGMERPGNQLNLDGSFENDLSIPPFGWQLSDSAGHSAVRLQSSESDGRYVLSLEGTEGGEAARQLLVLRPGSYQLTAQTGGVGAGSGSPPFISLSCTAGKSALVTQDFPEHSAAGSMTFRFEIPSQCDAQWLMIFNAPGGELRAETPWIDAIRITPSR